VAKSPYVLLPPSLGQRPGGPRARGEGVFDDVLGESRHEVQNALAQALNLSLARQESLFGARGQLLAHAIAANKAVAVGNASCTPAWRRFDGVVWTHLDPATLSATQRRKILVPSAVYGVVSASDPLAEYRLGFNATLAPLGRLSTYWRAEISRALGEFLSGSTVVDLLPHEHGSAIDFVALKEICEVRRVHFVSHDGARSVGHDAKAVKGRVARSIILHGFESLDGFECWGWRGHIDQSDVVIQAPKTREFI
jgi:cytoplasmic iron level regulating protein YaaA (DUF328/UPF0246 family)